MRQTFLLILLVAGIPSVTLGQATASDAQTVQALLTEVRELRRDLRASLDRTAEGGCLYMSSYSSRHTSLKS